jgi:hypothetical protein
MKQSILNRSRSDKFTLLMDLPVAMKQRTDQVLQQNFQPDKIQFTVFGSPVPKIEVKSINLPHGGQHLNITSNARTDYGLLTLKFLIDNGYQNYWTLWKWLDLFNDASDSTSEIDTPVSKEWDQQFLVRNPFSDYVTDFCLYALDEYNNKTMEFKYSKAFITSLSEINFSHQDETIITCSASFAYNQLLVNLINNPDKL